MAVKKVKIEDAVGMVLGHDFTKIIPQEYKGPAFKKGHIIREEDLPYLRAIGKEHIYLIDLGPGQLHENEAIAQIAKAVCGDNVYLTEPSEGRINIKSLCDGLLKIDKQAVIAINMIENAVLSTRHGNQLIKKDELIAGVKVVPLVVDADMVDSVTKIALQYQPVISVKPLRKLKVGLVITGNEVFYGRIKDGFAPVLTEKISDYGAELLGITYKPDDRSQITEAILAYKRQGADFVLASGGMSVDPDDVTPDAIRSTGASVITYGSPVLPGAMFMLAYLDNTTIVGLPACGMFAKITVFDLVFPRILAGEKLTKKDLAELGYGGLCLSCKPCKYPHCPFGK